ncbi:uncharacterized protein (DUF934 family) [Oxalobacteraceae bacterium GrIS 2.11]
MSEIIKDGQIVADDWSVLRPAEDQQADAVSVPDGKVIVPLAVWQAQHDALSKRGNVGVWLGGADRADGLKADLAILPVIAVDFPKFSDGRGYSIAYNVRARLGYQGELRAIGDVLRDQLFYMHRVGFNAFATRADRDIHDALKGLTDFSVTYQAAIDQKSPLFRRVERSTSHAS